MRGYMKKGFRIILVLVFFSVLIPYDSVRAERNERQYSEGTELTVYSRNNTYRMGVIETLPWSSVIVKFGDLNDNGEIDANDAARIVKIVSGDLIPTGKEEIAADINRDGFVDEIDCDLLQQCYIDLLKIVTVTFYSDGKAVFCEPVIYKESESCNYSILPSAGDIRKTGHTFIGWYYQGSSSGGTSKIISSYADLVSSEDHSLTAIWKPYEYTVKYHANGGSTVPSSQIKYYGTILELSRTVPLRAGYTFKGWSTDSKASEPAYRPGDYYTANRSVTLYAVWKKNPVAVTGVTLSKSSITLTMGSSTVLKSEVTPASAAAKTITWSSSNSKIATVSSSGIVKGIARGTAIITAKSNNGKTASCKVTVKVPMSKTTITVKNGTYTGKQVKPAVTVRYGSSTLKNGSDYTLQYGKNISAGTGTVSIVGKGYYTGTVKKTFTIAKKTQSITAASVTKVYGSKAFSLGAKAGGNGKLTYSSSRKDVAVISSKGVVTVKKCGKTTITINAAATQNYKAARKTVVVTVKPGKAVLKSVTSPGKRKISVQWKKDMSATGYHVCISKSRTFAGNVTKTFTYDRNCNEKNYSGNIFESGKTYYVRIRAYKDAGNTTIPGDWSDVKSVKIR